MLTSYEDALTIPGGEESMPFLWSDPSQSLAVERDGYLFAPGGVVLCHCCCWWLGWEAPIQILLRLPQVVPRPFSGDADVYGHTVRFRGLAEGEDGAEYFCRPRLRSSILEDLALDDRPGSLDPRKEYDFYYQSFFDRLYEKLNELPEKLRKREQYQSRARRIGASFLRFQIQEVIQTLVVGKGRREEEGPESGLPLTDPAELCLQRYQIELGLPDVPPFVPNADLRASQIKACYLYHLDPAKKGPVQCETLAFSKNHPGRWVLRSFPDGIVNEATQQPMNPRLAAINPMARWGNAAKVARENQAIGHCLDLVRPTPPPLEVIGNPTIPKALVQKMTTLWVAIGNLEGKNSFTLTEADATEFAIDPAQLAPGETLSLDGMALCPSGRVKLEAETRREAFLSLEEFEEQQEELEVREGFEACYVQEWAGETEKSHLDVYQNVGMRCRWVHRDHCRHSKLKLLYGGIKGITRPIEQLYALLPDGRAQPLDVVVSDETVADKGAGDLILGALAAAAGIRYLDPTWTRADLGLEIERSLLATGFPLDGRVAIAIKSGRAAMRDGRRLSRRQIELLQGLHQEDQIEWEPQYTVIGIGIVGPVPAIRPQETEDRASNPDFRGVPIDVHTRCFGIPLTPDREAKARIAELAQFFNEVDR